MQACTSTLVNFNGDCCRLYWSQIHYSLVRFDLFMFLANVHFESIVKCTMVWFVYII